MAKKILIVDDNPDTVTTLKMILERSGYTVASAANGEEGVQRTLEFLPDIVLLDIMMPIMDGYTMNQHLKGNPKTKNIPVIIISARSGMAPLFESREGPQVQGYLVKPFSTQILLTKIEELFGGNPA